MTIPEITAYVMALPVEDLRRLSATDVMGWELRDAGVKPFEPYYYDTVACLMTWHVSEWRPDEDRNQSRLVTDKVKHLDLAGAWHCINKWKNNRDAPAFHNWFNITPLDETRAALIAHMIHMQEAKNDPN